MTLTLVIANYVGSVESETLTLTQAKTFFDKLRYFVEEALDGNLYSTLEPSTVAYDLVELILKKRDEIRKFQFLLLTDGVMSNRIDKIDESQIGNIPVECQIWDIQRLFRLLQDNVAEVTEIDFSAYTGGKGLPCIEASATNSDEFTSFLCIIPGEVLADIYDKYGSHLLEGNVRSFLSTKVAVNKKIRETILSAPENFFAFNNGVAATANELRIEDTRAGKVISYAKNFQIINGGQTTASLSSARFKDKADLSRIFVQMKLTRVTSDEERSTELVRNISRSSNSQSKVSDADFFATHPFHVRMEQISRKLYAKPVGGLQHDTKWFYERARGQYLQAQMRMSKSERDKFLAQNPKKQVITKTDLAKVRNSWDGFPYIVSKGAQTNFVKYAETIDEAWTKDEKAFNDVYYEKTVALKLLFNYTEDLVSDQAWYAGGYRANIVTYSIALLHELIKKQYKDMDLDLLKIWANQEIPSVLRDNLLEITEAVYNAITDEKRGVVNVTQWCKRADCWKVVKECPIKLSAEIEDILISKYEAKSENKRGEKKQGVIDDFQVQSYVVSKGAQYWGQVYDFIIKNKIKYNGGQISAMEVASNMNGRRIPNSFQSKVLIEVEKTAIANGFKANHE
jgi:hypothetical protein